MRQSWPAALAILAAVAGCQRPSPVVTDGVVSLTPAGTDLLIAMGLGDRIVGVSTYEPNEAFRSKLPKVGDYLRVDFEKIAELRPKFIVIQGKRWRLPAGTRERCEELGVKPVIIQIDRLADIATATRQIGAETGYVDAANKAADAMDRRAAALRAARGDAPAVPTLVVFGDGGTNVIGRATFIDDALALAGGVNVIATDGYPTLDAEKLKSLTPAVVFLLLPGATSDVVERATKAIPGGSTNRRVIAITDGDVLMPGTSAFRLAETIDGHLRAAR